MVGDLCIIGEPNELGEIEIGYGTYNEYQGRGYMTEIVASTSKSNFASFKVLEKNNFKKISETPLLYNWKLEL